jgi:hypothetical protein
MDRYRTRRQRDRESRWFAAWFAFVFLLWLLFVGGVVWLIVYVVPHIVHMLDRIQ